MGSRIKSAVQQVGTGCIELVQDAGSLQLNPSAAIAQRDLSVHARKVLEHVCNVFFFIFMQICANLCHSSNLLLDDPVGLCVKLCAISVLFCANVKS